MHRRFALLVMIIVLQLALSSCGFLAPRRDDPAKVFAPGSVIVYAFHWRDGGSLGFATTDPDGGAIHQFCLLYRDMGDGLIQRGLYQGSLYPDAEQRPINPAQVQGLLDQLLERCRAQVDEQTIERTMSIDAPTVEEDDYLMLVRWREELPISTRAAADLAAWILLQRAGPRQAAVAAEAWAKQPEAQDDAP